MSDAITNLILKDNPGNKSDGKCAIYVRKAVQLALKMDLSASGIGSAYEFGPWLEKMGFVGTNLKYFNAPVGAVAVYEKTDEHPHGHI